MVLVKNLAILGEKETVTVDEKLFNGDINEFIEIILRKIIINLYKIFKSLFRK